MEFYFGDFYIENEYEVSLENYYCKVKYFCIGVIRVWLKYLWSVCGFWYWLSELWME